MKPFKVICIDDAFQPDSLPLYRRVVEGQTYTVIEVAHMQLQGVQGYRLQEIDSTFPYEYFKSTRFLQIETEVTKKAEQLENAI